MVLGRALLACFLLTGCGAKTLLGLDPAPDRPEAGVDAGIDGAIDSGTPDGGTLVVDCGRMNQFTAPRRPITLIGTAMGPDAIVEQGWTVVSTPSGSMPTIVSDPDPTRITLTPDIPGSFQFRFTARDAAARTASCEVIVMSIVGPPAALCPEEELFTIQDRPLNVEGDGFDDEMVVSYRWELVSAPMGATPMLTGTDRPTLEFRSATLGVYVLRLTVFDADGASGSCEATVRVTGPPMVRCAQATVDAPTRRPVTLSASATDDVGIASRRWEVLTRPSGSTASPMPTDADTTMFTPDRQGTYRLRYTATDVEGLSASCEVTVNGTPSPPDVTCPAMIDTVPMGSVSITASAVDDGTIIRWAWRVVTRPPGSDAASPSPGDQPTTRFTTDIAGIYELTVTATDNDGMTGSCTTRVAAGNVDGLRVEMFWDTSGTDMDLHLLNTTGTRWASNDDCYYINCTVNADGSPRLAWGASGPTDDPRLDIDDVDGFGPENINITTPQSGTYRIAVHNYSGAGPNRVTVRIYCGGSTTTPRATIGPVTLRGRGGNTANDFWRVADVSIAGTSCMISEIRRADGSPDVAVYNGTIGMR